MRRKPLAEVENGRLIHPLYESTKWNLHGAFCVGSLRILSSGRTSPDGWEHVSVSRADRIPNWMEMCRVKDWFWGPDETVIQLHVPAAKHVNIHEFCLHLWKPPYLLPLPPKESV